MSALFAKTNSISRQRSVILLLKIVTCNPSIYTTVQPYLTTVLNFFENSIGLKRVCFVFVLFVFCFFFFSGVKPMDCV